MPDFERLLQTSDVEVDASALVRIDGGFSSEVYATEDHVVKLLARSYGTAQDAHKQADTLYGEQGRISEYIDPVDVAMAHFVVGRATGGECRILLVQPKVEGVTIGEAAQASAVLGSICTYLESVLVMYG